MRKTIAIVANSSWNIYNFRQPLIKALKLAGYRVIVIAPVDEYIHYLNESYFTRHIRLRFLEAQSRNPFRDLLLFWELLMAIRRERPSLVLNFTIKPNIYGSLAASFWGIPSIAVVTGLGGAFSKKSWVNFIVRKLYKFSFRASTRVVFQNPDDQEIFRRLGLIKADKGMLISSSGVNTNYFRPLNRKNPNKDKFIFLFIGRLLHTKGIKEFAQAAETLRQSHPGLECWVSGQLCPDNSDAISKEQLLKWVERQSIRYLGFNRDIRQIIREADVVVLPSYYGEGVPRALLEAMAMGKPILTTDEPGCRETVSRFHNGLVVPAKDTKALKEAMFQLYTMEEGQLEAMGYRGRQKALNRFDEKKIVGQYLKLVRLFLKNPIRPSSKIQT